MQMLQILFNSSKFNVYTKFDEVYFTFEQVTVWNIQDRSNPKERHIAALIGVLMFFHNLQTSILRHRFPSSSARRLGII